MHFSFSNGPHWGQRLFQEVKISIFHTNTPKALTRHFPKLLHEMLSTFQRVHAKRIIHSLRLKVLLIGSVDLAMLNLMGTKTKDKISLAYLAVWRFYK